MCKLLIGVKFIHHIRDERRDGSVYYDQGIAVVTKVEDGFMYFEFEQPLIDPVVNARNKKHGVTKGGAIRLDAIDNCIEQGDIELIAVK